MFLLAGQSVNAIISTSKKPLKKLIWGGLLLLGGIQLYIIVAFSASMSHLDTRIMALQWIQNNIPYGSTIAIGTGPNSPPLPDLNRFHKTHYSSMSEQYMAKSLPHDIKQLYIDTLQQSGHYYYGVNYIYKASSGKLDSYDKMMHDFVILDYASLALYHPDYFVYSKGDDLFLKTIGKTNIFEIAGYKNHLIRLKSIQNGYISIYKF